ncbi:MAG: hypothetical protein ACJ75B_06240 [Flavisolibacter sp.]
MVTATGIFLGFMLNLTNEWIKQEQPLQRIRDAVIAIGLISSLCLLLLVLFRILKMNYPDQPEKFYRRTLLYFLVGISIPFIAFLGIIIEKILTGFFL